MSKLSEVEKKTYVAKALTLLAMAGVEHCVKYEGKTYGDLIAIPKPAKTKRVYDLRPIYKDVVDALEPGDSYTFVCESKEASVRLQGAVAAAMCQKFGNGNTMTHLFANEKGQRCLTITRNVNL